MPSAHKAAPTVLSSVPSTILKVRGTCCTDLGLQAGLISMVQRVAVVLAIVVRKSATLQEHMGDTAVYERHVEFKSKPLCTPDAPATQARVRRSREVVWCVDQWCKLNSSSVSRLPLTTQRLKHTLLVRCLAYTVNPIQITTLSIHYVTPY
jgi:hypothetical protein